MPAPSNLRSSSLRIGWTGGVTVLIAASLLVFPAGMAWMIALWLICHLVQVWRGRPGWMPLLVCLAVLLIKRVDWPWTLLVLAGAMSAIALLRAVRLSWQARTVDRRVDWIGGVVLVAAWTAFIIQSWTAAHTSQTPPLAADRPVVCLGDSLTSYGYPERLAALLSVPVLNYGADGITTAHALQRLPALLAENPQAVVIELGGHDYLQGQPRRRTQQNLLKIISAGRQIGAVVVLLEVPRGFITDPYAGLERELARQEDLELITDGPIRNLVLWSPHAPPGMWCNSQHHLSNDGLHPNENGNQDLAQAVQQALERVFGERISRPK